MSTSPYKKPPYEFAQWDRIYQNADGSQKLYRSGSFTINEMEINGVLFKDIKFPLVMFANENVAGTKRPNLVGRPPKNQDTTPVTPPLAAEAHAQAIRKSVEALASPVPEPLKSEDFWDNDVPF